MLTPAEELLAAVKEHATADVAFEFEPKPLRFSVHIGNVSVDVFVHHRTGRWSEEDYGNGLGRCRGFHDHDSASSAVYSAFLRARGGKS